MSLYREQCEALLGQFVKDMWAESHGIVEADTVGQVVLIDTHAWPPLCYVQWPGQPEPIPYAPGNLIHVPALEVLAMEAE